MLQLSQKLPLSRESLTFSPFHAQILPKGSCRKTIVVRFLLQLNKFFTHPELWTRSLFLTKLSKRRDASYYNDQKFEIQN